MNDVLKFWFEELSPDDHFKKSDELDRKIEIRFRPVLERAARAELWDWRNTADGRLSEIIVRDQFSRNIFRDDARAFAQDPTALVLAQEMIRLGLDHEVAPERRSFIYMPFMHSESKYIHEEAVRHFSQPGLENNLKFELLHKEIIDRFGRFPHRNKTLGRTSTHEEIEFLKTKNSSF